MMNISSGDIISSLPVDKNPPTQDELKILEVLLNDNSKGSFRKEAELIAILYLLFVIMSLDTVKNIIKKYISIANKSVIIEISIRALIFIVLFYIIKLFLFKNNK